MFYCVQCRMQVDEMDLHHYQYHTPPELSSHWHVWFRPSMGAAWIPAITGSVDEGMKDQVMSALFLGGRAARAEECSEDCE